MAREEMIANADDFSELRRTDKDGTVHDRVPDSPVVKKRISKKQRKILDGIQSGEDEDGTFEVQI
jgi:hypothetical protein